MLLHIMQFGVEEAHQGAGLSIEGVELGGDQGKLLSNVAERCSCLALFATDSNT